MQIRKVTKYLLEKYPLEKAEIWDPAGFSVKFNLSEKLNGIVCAIDLTHDVLNKAILQGANLIIVHHPFKFAPTWKDELALAPYKATILSDLKKYRINVLSLHTNYDNNFEGTSHQIALALGLQNKIDFAEPYPCLINANLSINDLKQKLTNSLNLHSFRTNSMNANQIYQNIAILSGSGPASLALALKNQANLILTSDIKWNEWLLYKEHNIDVLELSHLDEQVFAIDICKQIKNKFSDINVTTHLMVEPYTNL
ncbi:Hypothetical protein, putative NIF3 family protein [Mycoplasmopsis bovigenitalium 51080]|uniref:GTP cyclohydrolase 1 type 2 homolog n=1 Tax=Mycoplasmopsis bovigenitalium 51080 TaxID=1188235 RepID=N9TVT0_9BACT|nr:Nif3-like dinuclear metal center hexameric protein [Mycoplasmopsis bovigenitalium]ENY70214.1 Hypothetical protein, putative NIF3 family protein [Mycoplasmopsis bovigenitalium 51080]